MLNFKISNLRRIAIFATVLICFAFAGNSFAQDKQSRPLDDKGVRSLVDRLTEVLNENVEDEDQRGAITQKWEARLDKLAGKTAIETVAALLEDVRSVISDEDSVKTLSDEFESTVAANEKEGEPDGAPGPAPKPAPKPDYWLSFLHNGAYLAHIEVTWDEPGKPNQVWREQGKTAQWQGRVTIPADATNIRLRLQNDTGLVWQPQREIFNRILGPSDLNKCYRLIGTTLGSGYDNNCQ